MGEDEVCCDMAFSVATGLVVWVSRHGLWCHDKEAAWWSRSLLRLDFSLSRQGWPLGVVTWAFRS